MVGTAVGTWFRGRGGVDPDICQLACWVGHVDTATTVAPAAVTISDVAATAAALAATAAAVTTAPTAVL
jgi:hypothetical protein